MVRNTPIGLRPGADSDYLYLPLSRIPSLKTLPKRAALGFKNLRVEIFERSRSLEVTQPADLAVGGLVQLPIEIGPVLLSVQVAGVRCETARFITPCAVGLPSAKHAKKPSVKG